MCYLPIGKICLSFHNALFVKIFFVTIPFVALQLQTVGHPVVLQKSWKNPRNKSAVQQSMRGWHATICDRFGLEKKRKQGRHHQGPIGTIGTMDHKAQEILKKLNYILSLYGVKGSAAVPPNCKRFSRKLGSISRLLEKRLDLSPREVRWF